jgi:hypothetical protein
MIYITIPLAGFINPNANLMVELSCCDILTHRIHATIEDIKVKIITE